jgi:hypothetical protein
VISGEPTVPCFSLHVTEGKFSSAAIATVFENRETARQGVLEVLADLSRDICGDLSCNSRWQIELTDITGRPILRLSLLIETLVEENQANV